MPIQWQDSQSKFDRARRTSRLMPCISLLYVLFAWCAAIVPASALDAPAFFTADNVELHNGAFAKQLPVIMTAPAGSRIFFTTDGGVPDTSSQEYTAPIAVSKPTQLNAVAWQANTYSPVKTVYLDVDPSVEVLRQKSKIVMFTISGTINVGDVVTVVIYDERIAAIAPQPAGQRKFSYPVVSGDTTITIAANLRQTMVNDPGLISANITTDYTSGNSFFTVTSTARGNSTWFTQYVTPTGNLVISRYGDLTLRLLSSLGVVTSGSPPSSVSKWCDLSGCGNDGTSTPGREPVLGSLAGFPAVTFNGASLQSLSLPAGFVNFRPGASIFLVVAPSSVTDDARYFDLGTGSINDSMYVAENSPDGFEMDVYAGGVQREVANQNTLKAGRFQVLEGIIGGSLTRGTLYINGAVNGDAPLHLPNIIVRSSNYVGQASGGGHNYTGSIAELLVYSTWLSEEQRASVEASLIQRYQALSLVPDKPKISVPGGVLSEPTQVVISAPFGSTTYFTTDGSVPTVNSQVYCTPIAVSYTQTLTAISVKNGIQSGITTAGYTLDSVLWPPPRPSDTSPPTINLQLPTPSQ